jgi:hypothetical protein
MISPSPAFAGATKEHEEGGGTLSTERKREINRRRHRRKKALKARAKQATSKR